MEFLNNNNNNNNNNNKNNNDNKISEADVTVGAAEVIGAGAAGEGGTRGIGGRSGRQLGIAGGSGIAVVDDHADGGRQRRGLERVRLAPQPRHLLHERAHAGRRRRHGRQRRHRHLRVEDRLHFFGGEDVAVPDLDSIPTDDK